MKRIVLPAASSAARVRLHLTPGRQGTVQVLAQHGDRLVCVRYRYDATLEKRFTTAEIIVGERDREPPAVLAHDQIAASRIAHAEADARERVKRAGESIRVRTDRTIE